jgi:hypothetical protein
LNKWASNKSAIQSLPSNLKVSNRSVDSTKNSRTHFLKCDGTIAPVFNSVYNKKFTLNVSTLTHFVSYTDFNKLNPDDSLKVQSLHFHAWYNDYLLAKNPVQVQGSTIVPYEPSAIVSYHDSLGNKHNYICKITNIVYNQDGSGNPIPWFTFDTSKVVFYDSSSVNKSGTNVVPVPIVNDPEVTKIDTNFLPGTFSDIHIDFDPFYDPFYNHPLIPPICLNDVDMNIVKNNGKWIAAVRMMDRYSYFSYSSWSYTDNSKNQTLSVYVDNVKGLTTSLKSVLFNRTDTPPDNFKPGVKLEFRTRDGKTSTSTVQITDCYVYKDKLIFELNENVQLYNDNEELVSYHKTISNQLNGGSFTHVKMSFVAVVQYSMPLY